MNKTKNYGREWQSVKHVCTEYVHTQKRNKAELASRDCRTTGASRGNRGNRERVLYV